MHRLIKKNHEFWNHERSLSALLVYMSLSLFVWILLGDYPDQWWSFVLHDLLFNLIIIAGIFSVFVRWREQLLFIATALLASFVRILYFITGREVLESAGYLFSILFFALLTVLVMKRIFKEGAINFYRVAGSIVVFMIIGVVFAMLYTLLERWSPGSFVYTENSQPASDLFSQLLYFSFVIMTTVGLGDMIPVKPLAKSLVVLQSIVGLLYPVIMIARLISMEVSHSMQNRKSERL